ncbi:MAG: hypothetical protein Tsb004_22380 [Allomuricauda sp.]
MKQLKVCLLAFLAMACSKGDTSDLAKTDMIVGMWRISGGGIVYSDESDEYYYENEDFCTLKSRFSFKDDGTFRVETFDGSENDCISTGVLTGTWENQGESYFFKIITDTSATPEEGSSANITIQFPDSDTMRWLEESESEAVDYFFEEYIRAE